MTEFQTPTRVRGLVGPKVLAKSADLFDQSLNTIFRELFQNSRRAGATRIDVTVVDQKNGSLITIADDGKGVDNPQILLTFGGSGWDEHLDTAENAAGMGFFSIASRGGTVRSTGWRVTLTPAVFRGTEEAIVLKEIDAIAGTQIEFSSRVDESPKVAVAQAAKFLPIPVTLNGEPTHQEPFLKGAIFETSYAGITIGIYSDTRSSSVMEFNFHGVVASSDAKVRISEVFGSDYTVKFDVIEAPDLKLVLPTRHKVVENEFFDRLLSEAKKAVYTRIAALPSHTLPFKNAKEARDLGIDLPDATIKLSTWTADKDDFAGWATIGTEGTVDGSPAALVDFDEQSLNATFKTAIGEACGNIAFCNTQRAFIGYPAYDQLRQIDHLRCMITLESDAQFELRLTDNEIVDHTAIIAAAVAEGEPTSQLVAKSI
ncbi:MAG TPA: ATP-binding protein, partial [Chloroflexota bacterium]|nr:ATP-binding protein [Chloroflexota bacterium]